MFAVKTRREGRLLIETSLLGVSDALYAAVQTVAQSGADCDVVDLDGLVRYSVEADTKVDLDDPHYPVIVHVRRGGVSS